MSSTADLALFINQIKAYGPVSNIICLCFSLMGVALNLPLLWVLVKTRTFDKYQDIFSLLKVLGDLQMSSNFAFSCASYYFIERYGDLLANANIVQALGFGLLFGIEWTFTTTCCGPIEPFYLLVMKVLLVSDLGY